MPDKTSLRRVLRARRSFLSSGEEGALRSVRIQEQFLASRFWRECRRVVAYVSVKGEPGTERILKETLCSGRELFLPRCRLRGEEGWPGAMDFIFCAGLEGLEPSRFPTALGRRASKAGYARHRSCPGFRPQGGAHRLWRRILRPPA